MIDFVGTRKQEHSAQRAQEAKEKGLRFLAGLTLLLCVGGGLIYWLAPEPKESRSLRFRGSVEFADKRPESREMIEFTFVSAAKITYLEKKNVEWDDSDFEVTVEIPKDDPSTEFSAMLDHPGYKRLELDSVDVLSGDVKFPVANLERKWRTPKKRRQRKPPPVEKSLVAEPDEGRSRRENARRSLQELERNTQRPKTKAEAPSF